MRRILVFVVLFGLVHIAYSLTLRFADTKKCNKRNGNFPKPGSFCRSYYKCKNWQAKEVTCPEDQHFFPESGYCVWSEEYPCLEKPKSRNCPLPNGKFLKPRTRCKVYYDCCKGVATEKKCPEDSVFDQDREKCDWPELVYCPEVAGSTTSSRSPSSHTAGIITSTRRLTSKKVFTTPPSLTSSHTLSTTDSGENSSEEDKSSKGSSSSEEDSSSEEYNSSNEGDKLSTKSKDLSTNPSTSTLSGSSFDVVTSQKSSLSTHETPLSSNDVSPELPNTTPNLKSSSSSENITKRVVLTSASTETAEDISTSTVDEEISINSKIATDTFTPTVPMVDEDNASSVSATNEGSSTTEPVGDKNNISTSAINEKSSTKPIIVDKENISKISVTDEDSFTTRPIVEKENVSKITAIDETSSSTEPMVDRESISTTNIIINETLFTEPKVDKDSVSTRIIPLVTDSITIDIFCPESDGNFPHPNDRYKYIACVAGHPTVMDCPAKLVYDPKNNYCDYETLNGSL